MSTYELLMLFTQTCFVVSFGFATYGTWNAIACIYQRLKASKK